ncbi:MAG: hypothetical protein ACT4QG_01625 [Sporichthyaceae bacterium]
MTEPDDHREVIPGGWQEEWPGWHHVKPLIRFLVEERGHLLLHPDEPWGVVPLNGGRDCSLTRMITEESWAALNERFVIPDNIGYMAGFIRDFENGIDISGYDWVIGLDGKNERIEPHEAELRAKGLGGCPPE